MNFTFFKVNKCTPINIKKHVMQVMQLNAALQLKKAVILIGPAGCGKTTCSRTLARATNRLNFLLFAPDHSKDELTTNRDLIYYAKNKLKVKPSEKSRVIGGSTLNRFWIFVLLINWLIVLFFLLVKFSSGMYAIDLIHVELFFFPKTYNVKKKFFMIIYFSV